jgi:hypothetical protein
MSLEVGGHALVLPWDNSRVRYRIEGGEFNRIFDFLTYRRTKLPRITLNDAARDFDPAVGVPPDVHGCYQSGIAGAIA